MKRRGGTFEGKEIEFSTDDRVAAAAPIADDFMFEIFDLDFGEYLITDESALADFTDFGCSDTGPFWNSIRARYAVGPEDVCSDKLVDIFDAIIAKQNPQ